jgi:aerobic carbon-monoxide dehydrogenase medium subunit
MKAPAFDYVRPQTLGEAVGLLASSGGEARVIAGGQSLLALMNLRLASPALVIDIARLPELTQAAEDEESVTLGACVTHAMIEDGRVPDPSRGLMPQVAAGISFRAVRNRGTIGGSLALADPAADWPPVLTALGAELTLYGRDGRRTVDCTEFATASYQTQLAGDEILESVRIPKLAAEARVGFAKLCRPSALFADALAATVSTPSDKRCCVVVGAANGAPLAMTETARALAERTRDREQLRAAIEEDLDQAGDRHLDDFQRQLLAVAAMRAIQPATA